MVMDLEPAQARARRFVEERDWVKYHNPKNLAMALAGEVGELIAIFQWRTEQDSERLTNSPDFQHVCEEVADIVIYTLRLADVLGIDLEQVVHNKLSLNEQRYPVQASRDPITKNSVQGLARTVAGRSNKMQDGQADG
jgi:dCTP diphosphatase